MRGIERAMRGHRRERDRIVPIASRRLRLEARAARRKRQAPPSRPPPATAAARRKRAQKIAMSTSAAHPRSVKPIGAACPDADQTRAPARIDAKFRHCWSRCLRGHLGIAPTASLWCGHNSFSAPPRMLMAEHIVPHFHNDPGVPVIEIGAKEFMCVGANAAVRSSAHLPRHGRRRTRSICPYCSTLYRHDPALDPHAAHTAGMRARAPPRRLTENRSALWRLRVTSSSPAPALPV